MLISEGGMLLHLPVINYIGTDACATNRFGNLTMTTLYGLMR